MLTLPVDLDAQTAERDRLREQVASRVADTAQINYVPNDKSATHLVSVISENIVELASDGRQLRPVRVRLQPLNNGPEFSAVGRGLPLVDIAASTLTGFDDAWKVIAAERKLSIAEDTALIEALTHPDRRLREFVIETLGDRRAKVAVLPLCNLLSTEPEPDLVLRTVGALVSIGDERAVDPLIDLARNKHSEVVIQIAYALGSLGSPAAEGYLVTLASGHEIEAVRKAAEQALKDLASKRTKK